MILARLLLVHEGCFVRQQRGHACVCCFFNTPPPPRSALQLVPSRYLEQERRAKMPGNKKKNKGANKAKNAAARSNAANKDDLAGLDDLLR